MPPCLKVSTIRYGSRVNEAIQKKMLCPPLHLGLVAIEKGAFESPSTTVANIYINIYIYIYMDRHLGVKPLATVCITKMSVFTYILAVDLYQALFKFSPACQHILYRR